MSNTDFMLRALITFSLALSLLAFAHLAFQ